LRKLRDREIDSQNLKALILGMNGTLLDDSKEISDCSLEAIEKLKRKETRIAVSTGRDYIMAREYLNILDLEGPHVLQNRASLINGKDETIARRWVDGNTSSFVYELVPLWGVMFFLGQILQVFLIGFMRAILRSTHISLFFRVTNTELQQHTTFPR